MMALQDRFIFPRDVVGARDASVPSPRGWEQLTVTGEDGSKVPGWLSLPIAANGARVPVVMFFHGNAEVIDDLAQSAEIEMYRGMGVGVLLMEYRGYGRAQGAPSQRAIVADSVKMYDLLAARPEVDRERVVLYGRSLGGGVACALAKERRPRAMVLQSTFTSVTAIAARMGIPGFLVRHPFRNDEVVASLDVPILFMHGAHDSIIPCGHSQALLRLAKQGRMTMQNCDHNDFPTDLEAYRRGIEAFLRESGVVR
jgi:fermentation-respiration switch protein FrsA (DUF1100 family)